MFNAQKRRVNARRRGFTMIEIMIVLAVIAIIALIAIPNLLAGKTAANESATIANLKTLTSAQFQYHKKTDFYAAGAAVLGNLQLIAPDMVQAFENFHDNGDARVSPKSGYYYRVLHGTAVGETSWWQDGTSGATAKMNSFGFTCRSAEPYSTGEFQYFIGEQGSIYKKAEPKQGETGHRLYLLNALPDYPPSTWLPAK